MCFEGTLATSLCAILRASVVTSYKKRVKTIDWMTEPSTEEVLIHFYLECSNCS